MGPAYGQHNATATVDGTSISQTLTATYGFAVTMQEQSQSQSLGHATLLPGTQLPKNLGLCDMFDPNNAATVALFKDLGPGVLRFLAEETIGAVAWDPTGPGLNYGTVTTADITRVAAFVKAANWKVLYGIGLLNTTPAAAASEAAVAAQEFGSSLLGFEIGNEPDNYALPTMAIPRPHKYLVTPGQTTSRRRRLTPMECSCRVGPLSPTQFERRFQTRPSPVRRPAATPGLSILRKATRRLEAFPAHHSLLCRMAYRVRPTMTTLLAPDP